MKSISVVRKKVETLMMSMTRTALEKKRAQENLRNHLLGLNNHPTLSLIEKLLKEDLSKSQKSIKRSKTLSGNHLQTINLTLLLMICSPMLILVLQ